MLLYLRRYKWRYLAGLLALLSASLVVMVPPVVLRNAIDGLGTGTSSGQLAQSAAIIFALAVVEGLLRFATRKIVSGTSRWVEFDLRSDLARHLTELDQHFYLKAQTGDLMARCTNDLQVIRDLMGPTVIDIARIVTMMLIGLGFLLTINVRLALLAVAYFPIIGFVIAYFELTVEAKFTAVQTQFGQIATRVQENITGIRTIKAYAQEHSEIATFEAANREMLGRSMAWAYYTAALWPLMVVLTGASTVLVLWFGGHDVVSGKITLGQFVQFNTYLAILANPVLALGWTATAFQQGLAAMKRVTEVLNTFPRVADPAHPTPLMDPRGEIELRAIRFGYGDRPVLDGLDLRIPAGSTVALVASTGGGKTTLVNLLLRLHDPWDGQVLLDGVDIRQMPLQDLRAAIGVVPQETFLFSESLRDNIGYGRLNASPGEFAYAIETSGLSNDLAQLTHGIDTVIGERGVTLSGGQKQRAALARALLKQPPVLILDDALSHVDTHTEEEVLRHLREFMKARTTIIIAHRTSTLAAADLIAVLDGGSIAETGTHAELLRLNGIYARFYRRQLLAEQIEDGSAAAAEPVEARE